jgi:hypothetical protein
MLNEILFCPLDIEIENIEFDSFIGTPVVSKYNPYWNSTLLSDEVIKKNNFDKILNQLPFDKITNIQYKIQQKEVGPHVDVYAAMNFSNGEYEHILDTEPAGYRFVVKGEIDSLETFNGKEYVVAALPKVPCGYILNSTSAIHRVKEDESRTTIYIRGWLNKERHLELLKRSYEKFSSYVVLKK